MTDRPTNGSAPHLTVVPDPEPVEAARLRSEEEYDLLVRRMRAVAQQSASDTREECVARMIALWKEADAKLMGER